MISHHSPARFGKSVPEHLSGDEQRELADAFLPHVETKAREIGKLRMMFAAVVIGAIIWMVALFLIFRYAESAIG